MIIETDKTNFKQHIQKPCVADFYTTGCPVCEKLAPVLEEFSQQCDTVNFIKVNLDEDITLAEQYDITHVPTLILFNEGKPVNTNTGFLDKEELAAFISSREVTAR